MPYIITTTPREPRGMEDESDFAPSRRAVATLDEARRESFRAVMLDESSKHRRKQHIQAALNLPEQGGTIGPLPDGTVIEVEPLAEIACPGNEFHGPCGKPAHWRDGAGLTGLHPSGAFECSDTRCWTMTTLEAAEYHANAAQ